MLPYLHLGSLSIPTFGLMLWLAAVAGAWMMHQSFRREGIKADAVGMVAVALVVGLIGAKLWHVLDTPSEFQMEGWSVLWDRAGFAWYGGLTFGIAALVVQGWRARLGWLRTLDLAAPAAAVGYAVGRIGCLLSGDGDYGIATKLHWPWGMSFPNGIVPTPPGVRVLPTPLYEFGVGLLIAWWLWRRAGRPHAVGMIVGQYLFLSGLARFLVEFVRRNPKVLWGMSNAQVASIGSMVVGLGMAWWVSRRAGRPNLVAEKRRPVGRPV